MRTWVVASAVCLGGLWATAACAHEVSYVSLEVGGAVSSYDLGASPTGSSHAALSTASMNPMVASSSVAAAMSSAPSNVANGIGVFEIRQTVVLEKGLLFAIGFRDGQAGLGRGGTNLVGGDVSLGYACRWGRFLPFITGRFGFNNYDALDGNQASPKRTDLRLDAVIGTRLYVAKRMYLLASAFGGLGDQFGGAVAVGGDIVQIYRRGRLP
jgi:hypothetical protein